MWGVYYSCILLHLQGGFSYLVGPGQSLGGGLLFGGDFIIWERVTIWEEVYSAEMGKTAFFS